MMTNRTNRWLVMWDCYGLEYLYNLTEFEESQTWSALMEEESPVKPPANLDKLFLRAKLNEHRNYEIYVLEADKVIDRKNLESLFKDQPQRIVDLIREQGFKICDCRRTREPVIK